MSKLVSRFADLFEGRKDAYGADHGECMRVSDDCAFPTSAKWWSLWKGHLTGQIEPIGIYPIVEAFTPYRGTPEGRWQVKWGCSDEDTGDLQAAINLRNALKVLDITAWIEVSKSKGYHVWVFAQQWVPAATMRRALLAAHDIADVPATEVNPKQETLAEGQVGNYVRLPYPGALSAEDGVPSVRGKEAKTRQVVIFDEEITSSGHAYSLCPLEDFVGAAERRRTPLSVLESAASLYYTPPPEPKPLKIERGVTARVGALVTRLNGLAYTIFTQGPLDGHDRSGTLYKLAVNSFESGLTPSEVYAILEDADGRWGKFAGRKDGPQQLVRIVARAASA